MTHNESMAKYRAKRKRIEVLYNPTDDDYIKMAYWIDKLEITQAEFIRLSINNMIAQLEKTK